MKKTYILSILAGLVLSAPVYAQSRSINVQGNNVILGYYESNRVMHDSEMGEPVFLNDFRFSNIEDEDSVYVGVVTDEPGWIPNTACFDVKVSGTLSVSGRTLEFPSEIVGVIDVNSSVVFKSFIETSEIGTTINTGLGDFDNVLVDTSSDNLSWVVNDETKLYWLIYRVAKELERREPSFRFLRGSEDAMKDVTTDATGRAVSHIKYDNELFYYVKSVGGVDVYYPVVYTNVEPISNDFSVTYPNNKNRYEITTVPHGLFNGSLDKIDITIGESIESLPSFEDAVVNNFYVDPLNKNYISVCDNKILCTKDENGNPRTIISVAIDESANYRNLPLTIDSIAPNALCKDATGVKLYTHNGGIKNAEGSTITTWDGIVSEPENWVRVKTSGLSLSTTEISVPVAYMQPSKANGAYNLTVQAGNVDASDVIDYLDDLKGSDGLCFIDLSAATINGDLGEITMSDVNPNCLLFLPEGATVSGTTTNIVTMSNGKRTCADLSLVRQSGVPFSNPYEFTAANVSVGYSIGSNLVGLVLPFEYKNINVKKAIFSGYSDGSILLTNLTEADDATEANVVRANTPFVAKVKDGVASQPITASNVLVKTTDDIHDEVVSGWTMSGTYLSVTNKGTGCTIYGYAQNKLMRVDGATFKPFSGYFVSSNANGANEAKFRFVSDVVTGVDAPEAIFAVKAENGAISVVASGANVVIASVNGAVLYNGKVNGTLTKEVNPGVYVVNGKKVVVNK